MSTPQPQFRFNPLTGKLDLSDVAGGAGGQPYPGGVLAWTNITSSSQSMSVDNGYVASNAMTRINFSLPASCAFGKIFRIVGNGLGLFRLSTQTGQKINYGASSTTPSTGYLDSTDAHDAIELLCTVANTEFTVINGTQGNFTVV